MDGTLAGTAGCSAAVARICIDSILVAVSIASTSAGVTSSAINTLLEHSKSKLIIGFLITTLYLLIFIPWYFIQKILGVECGILSRDNMSQAGLHD
ncbi:MAG: hypothetical protein NTU92_00810 [Methylotenera sp.]|nr:hypothetical protein [Methylotenera sp.]